MKRVVNSKEMKQCDESTIKHFGVPSLVLMERAALSVAGCAAGNIPCAGSVLIVCGNGNNGADGLAVARLLYQKGMRVCVVQTEDNGKRTEENITQRNILKAYGIPVLEEMPENGTYQCVIEALYGIGLTRPVTGKTAGWIRQMNQMEGYKIAVDMPCGVSADHGAVYEPAFCADATVTFAYPKAGQLLYPGREMCGMLTVADIGITDESWQGRRPSCYALESADPGQMLPVRPARSHKGTFGRLLVFAGSKDMAGAAVFCAKAAYMAGCGLVKIITPEENREVIQGTLAEAVLLTPGEAGFAPEDVAQAVRWADVIALGPGIGTGDVACRLTGLILEQAKVPVVIDADGLNIIAKHPKLLKTGGEIIITPHPGEMAGLTGKTVPEILDHLADTALEFAICHKLTCVLKDAATVTACADGTFYINTSGCSAMAKGGSGDVLTGIIAGLLAQGMSCEKAAALGVFLHGLAGETAAGSAGGYSVLAGDIVKAVGTVMGRIS